MNQHDQMREAKRKAEQALAAQAAPTERALNTLGYAQGIEAVANMLDVKADDYAKEFGFDDMGGLEFSREAQREYHSTLIELAEEVRAMVSVEPAPLVRLTDDEVCQIQRACSFEFTQRKFANAIMDAMIAKNKGAA